jgi:3-deoxy-D-manno-octulosonate 8-phosphate phosphatase KdsC-like HAD superfamily phosphatase
MPAALAAADFIPARRAGHGAVREICELILAGRTAPAQIARYKAGMQRSKSA